jgi:CarboxypepD_reg-like domain
MKQIYILLILLWTSQLYGFTQASQGQTILLKGNISDNATHQSLAYVSIGLLNMPLGTISDSNGNYILVILEGNRTDTLQISLVGYTTKKMLVSELLKSGNQNISLNRKDYIMPAVVINNRKINTRIIGRESSSKLIQISVHNKETVNETIGSEMGMRIKSGKADAYLKDINWYFSANNFKLIRFRVNVYSLKNNMPDTLLTDKEIFALVEDYKTGWIKFNLEPYNILVNGDFIITLQWIESRMEKNEDPVTLIPVGMSFSKNAYARVASQDKWKKMGYNLSLFVTLRQ